VVVPEHGGVDVLEVQDRPRPEPGPGQLLVEVAASGVNFIDVYQREGVYDVPTPFVLGLECAGTVVEVGDDVADLRAAATRSSPWWTPRRPSRCRTACLPRRQRRPCCRG
jgi:NADPH2:quinone reductase